MPVNDDRNLFASGSGEDGRNPVEVICIERAFGDVAVNLRARIFIALPENPTFALFQVGGSPRRAWNGSKPSVVGCRSTARPSTPLRPVALMGIAQRQVRVNHPINSGNQERANALKVNLKTAGDWLKVKRLEKNLTPGQVAAKMGIATSLVCSWENNCQQPECQQLDVLASVLDFDGIDFEKFTISLPKMS